MAHDDKPYALSGNKISDQAEPSTANRSAGMLQMRILIELQVLTMLLHSATGSTADLVKLRQDVADSIT